MKRTSKKLQFKRETVTRLDNDELKEVAGGVSAWSCPSYPQTLCGSTNPYCTKLFCPSKGNCL